MSAYEIPNLRFSGEAGGKITRRRFVTLNSDEQVIQVTSDSQEIIGVSSQPNDREGEVAEVYDGIVMVEAGGAIVAGTAVSTDSEGRAVTTELEGIKSGVAITNAGAAGELVSVKL